MIIKRIYVVKLFDVFVSIWSFFILLRGKGIKKIVGSKVSRTFIQICGVALLRSRYKDNVN